MERDRILGILREHEAELKAAGLLHLRLFGSVARGEETPESDVDLLFDYDEAAAWNLMQAYGMQDYLDQLLGTTAHLSSRRYLRDDLREQVLHDAIVAF